MLSQSSSAYNAIAIRQFSPLFSLFSSALRSMFSVLFSMVSILCSLVVFTVRCVQRGHCPLGLGTSFLLAPGVSNLLLVVQESGRVSNPNPLCFAWFIVLGYWVRRRLVVERLNLSGKFYRDGYLVISILI